MTFRSDHHSPPPAPHQEAAGQAAPSGQSPHDSLKDGAAKVPTAAAYVARWEKRLAAAVPSEVDELTKLWDEQGELRGQIKWPNHDTAVALISKVTQGLDWLRAPVAGD